jgi:hypothetical protein
MNILTVNLLFSTLVFGLAAKLYLMPRLPDLEPRSVVLPILLLHAFRHLGLMFLAPGAVYPGIPEEFAHPAALGDMLAAALALIAIPAVVGRSRLARPLVGLFNVEGTLDLIVAILLATAYNAAPYMGPAYWIPAFWVPALACHPLCCFRSSRRPLDRAGKPRAGAFRARAAAQARYAVGACKCHRRATVSTLSPSGDARSGRPRRPSRTSRKRRRGLLPLADRAAGAGLGSRDDQRRTGRRPCT